MYTRRMRSILVSVLVLAGCATMPQVDPNKLSKALESMDKAAKAVQAAIEDARDAAPLPESEQLEGEPVQAEPLPE